MNKKLLTVAISAAISSIAMTAQADVKVYGRVQAEVAYIKNKPVLSNATTGATSSETRVVDVGDFGGGTLGVAADEDLGGGMKAIGKIEFVTNTAGDSCQQNVSQNTTTGVVTVTNTNGQCTSDSSLKGDREQFVGLQSGMGTLRLGRVNSPYKLTGVALDPFVTTALEARGNGGMSPAPALGVNVAGATAATGGTLNPLNPLNTHKSGYVNNGIVYNSPKFAGLGVDVYYSPDSQNSTRGDVSAALTWSGGPASAFLAYSRDAHGNGNNGTGANYHDYNDTATKIGGQFKLGAAGTLSAQYEQLKAGIGGAGSKENVLFVGYQLPIDKWTVVVQGGLGNDDSSPKTKSTYLAAGARYNFSKTFSAYGGVRTTTLKDSDAKYVDQQAATIGLRKDF